MTDVPTERVMEILAGCEGVTPGPWRMKATEVSSAVKPSLAVANAGRGWCSGINGSYGIDATEAKANAAHIAACDPDTIRSLLTELLALRAALKRLSFAAQTTGGTAGPDAELQAAIEQAARALQSHSTGDDK